MVVSINGATPSYHPFIDRIFPEINHLFWGTPMAVETLRHQRPLQQRPRSHEGDGGNRH